MGNLNNEEYRELLRAIVKLSSEEQAEKFLEDVCTIKELEAMSQRLQVARLLKEGRNYLEVSRLTGASTATISRVNKCLMYGSGGYSIVLEGKEDK